MPITLNGNGSISGLDSVVSNSTVTALGFIPSGSTAVSDGIFLPGANSLGLATASTQRVHIDSSGRVGIGKTPDATAFPVVGGLQLAGGANLFSWGNFGGTYLTANAFYNGSNWIYQANNASSVYIAADGNHVWLRASSGTAGNTATLLESARIDTSGRLLVGTSTARDFFGGTDTPALQVEGIGNAGRELSVTSSTASGSGGVVLLAKQRSGAVGGQTIVQSGDQLGYLGFQGSDGAKMLAGAAIEATVDGTPGVNDLPTRLVFSTTADGASSPTERMRITSTGQMRLAGAGITFNGDTATANELDDYEEGTWTPVLSFGGGSVGISYTTAPVGYYTRIGRLVYASTLLTSPISPFQIHSDAKRTPSAEDPWLPIWVATLYFAASLVNKRDSYTECVIGF